MAQLDPIAPGDFGLPAPSALDAIRSRTTLGIARGALALVLLLLAGALLRGELGQTQLVQAAAGATFGGAWLGAKRWPHRVGAVMSSVIFVVIAGAAYFKAGSGPVTQILALAAAVVMGSLCWNGWAGSAMALISIAVTAHVLVLSPVVWPDAGITMWLKVAALLALVALMLHSALDTIKQTAQRIAERDRRITALIHNSHDSVLVLNRAGEIHLVNQQASQFKALNGPHILGRSVLETAWLDAASNAQLAAIIGDVGSAPAFELRTQQGHTLEASLASLRDGPDERWRLLIVRDISERMAAERSRAALEKRAEEARTLESLGRLAGGIAHDFNNLLTVILASAELARLRDDLDDELQESLADIEDAGHRAAELTQQLLAYSRRQVLRPGAYDPAETLQRLAPMLRRLLPSSIELSVETHPDTSPVLVDEAQLEQALVHLIANSRDVMPQGGAITLEACDAEPPEAEIPTGATSRTHAHVRISVTDTGPAMSEEEARHIFEPFFTGDRLNPSGGLALATVKGIVDQSGGQVVVTSTAGQGARFDMYFPATRASKAAQTGAVNTDKAADRPCTPGLRVLLVEDQATVRQAVRRMLTTLGHAVTEAEDGQSALRQHADAGGEFDLLLTDIVMPGLPGTELAAKLIEHAPQLKVLYMSGYSEGHLQSLDRNHAVQEHLPKPFDRNQLQAAIDKLTGSAKPPSPGMA